MPEVKRASTRWRPSDGKGKVVGLYICTMRRYAPLQYRQVLLRAPTAALYYISSPTTASIFALACCDDLRSKSHQSPQNQTVRSFYVLPSDAMPVLLSFFAYIIPNYFVRKYSSMACAAFLPAPMAKITVAAPVTASPPA